MKYCPFYSKTWSCCMIKTIGENKCKGNVDASCKEYQSAMHAKIDQERKYRDVLNTRNSRPNS